MAQYLELSTWARREVFEFFRGFDKPYFNICTRLDITDLLELLRRRSHVSVSLAYHYFALRVANEIEPFRYRLRDGKVLVYDVIHGGTTVMLPNESFTLAYFAYDEDFAKFIDEAERSVNEVQAGDGALAERFVLEALALYDDAAALPEFAQLLQQVGFPTLRQEIRAALLRRLE